MADSGASGLRAAETCHYDAVIVDIVMPGTDGFQFVEQLRRIQPNIPIIIISGWDLKRCQEQAERLGLVACLPKPIDFSHLCRVLKRALEKKHPTQRQNAVHSSHPSVGHTRVQGANEEREDFPRREQERSSDQGEPCREEQG